MYFIKPTDPNPITPFKAAMLGVLCLIWLFTGLIGHDPWKPDETTSFGIIYSMLHLGNWLIPSMVGEPYMDKPPLFYWTAALFAKLCSPWLALHDGARLACGFYMAISLWFMGLAGRTLYGENRGWATVIILIGCVGLLTRAHMMSTDLALLSGCAMMLYGFTLSQEKYLRAGLLIGTGAGIGFMAKGFIAPIFLLLISVGLLVSAKWRVRPYYLSLAIAGLAALPWLSIWPLLLYLRSPAVFIDWAWTHNIGNWLNYIQQGPNKESLYYLKNLPWLAWPALPLAAWVVWQSRHRLAQRDDLHIPLISFAVMFITLSFVPNIKEVFALPMLLPIALLATASLNVLRRGAANALEWFGIMTFALCAIAMWWGWAGLILDNHAKITQWLKDYQPGFEPSVDQGAFVMALIASLLWLILVWRISPSMRRAVLNWAGGMTLMWVLSMTLWLPWLESGKTYRHMVFAIKRALPHQYQCIANENLGTGQRAMLHYFGNILTQHDPDYQCEIRLVQGQQIPTPLQNTDQWHKIWEGSRMGDKNEIYHLYVKKQ